MGWGRRRHNRTARCRDPAVRWRARVGPSMDLITHSNPDLSLRKGLLTSTTAGQTSLCKRTYNLPLRPRQDLPIHLPRRRAPLPNRPPTQLTPKWRRQPHEPDIRARQSPPVATAHFPDPASHANVPIHVARPTRLETRCTPAFSVLQSHAHAQALARAVRLVRQAWS
jgi:hypothetical protein